MKMRKVTSDQIASLEQALASLKAARTAALAGGARKTWRKVHSAIKSCQGAINHADRAAFVRTEGRLSPARTLS